MKRTESFLLAVAIVLANCALAPRVTAQESKLPLETRNFMRGKLAHSQKILEGITTDNFDLVIKHAQEMSLLSMESQWNVLRTQQYVDESAEFRHSLQRLTEAAQQKKIDAAALSYVDVTLKCVHCHKYVRNRGADEAIGQNRLLSPAPLAGPAR